MSDISALAYKTKHCFINLDIIARKQSSFKVIFVIIFALGFEAGLYLLFLDGFKYFSALGGARLMILGRLFSLFFLGMGLMLILSSIATSYTTIFRSDEIPFLIVRPFKISHIILYKFIESTGLSSWAFFLIIIPFVASYAWHEQMTLLFSLWTLIYSVPYLVLCSGIGTIVTIVFVRWFPRHVIIRLFSSVIIIGLLCGLWWFKKSIKMTVGVATFNLSRIVPGFQLASNELLPNWWLSEGIMSLARNQWFRGFMLWSVLISSCMMIFIIIELMGNILFYKGWQRVTTGSGRKYRTKTFLNNIELLLPFLPCDIKALIIKDIRTFFRDPMQWSQVIIFFGLLGLYFANLRTFDYHEMPDKWRNIISFLNIFSTATIMSSLGSRFVYPQLSLDGQSFWIVGLSPTTMTKILMTKFVATLIGMLVISVSLMLLSTAMMNAGLATRVIAVALACATSLATCGLSTGLGAIFIDLDQRNPIAIVSGFGGTLNLALSLGFMISVILPFGYVFNLSLAREINSTQTNYLLICAGLWLSILTAVTTIVPLWIGNRSLKKREF